MRKLMLIVLALAVLLALLVTGAYAIPVRRTAPDIVRDLHLTDCAPPCWAGIMVGQTSLDDAYQRISDAFTSYPDAEFHQGSDNIAFTVGLGPNRLLIGALFASVEGTIMQISLITDRVQGLMMSDVVAALGPPTCLQRNIANYETPEVQFAVVGASRYLPSKIPVTTITIRRELEVSFYPHVCV